MAEIIELNKYKSKKPTLFQIWSQKEILDYQETREVKLNSSGNQEYQKMNRKLELIYDKNKIPQNNPKARMEYITNTLEKIGYNFEKDSTNILAEIKGKGKALSHLEDILLIEKSNIRESTIIE